MDKLIHAEPTPHDRLLSGRDGGINHDHYLRHAETLDEAQGQMDQIAPLPEDIIPAPKSRPPMIDGES